MHFLHPNLIKSPKMLLLGILLLLDPQISLAFGHTPKLLAHTFRYIQERLLRTSLNRAKLNYEIVFECRSIADRNIGSNFHFSLRLGDMRGFRLLDSSKKLALFLHGWNDEGSKDWVQQMFLTWTWFEPNYSVCIVDWGHLSQSDYKSASMSIFDVGLTVAGIIQAWEQLRPTRFTRSNVTIAGYSLGAHAAGYAGYVLNGEVGQIIGLDPAGPLFTFPEIVSNELRLDATDAQFVQVLHTSSGTLGSNVKSGHADFYPNGGRAPQPNCHSLALPQSPTNHPIACSHSTAAVFFKQAMDPSYPFVGVHCESHLQYVRGQCSQNRRGRFGVHSRRTSHGNFYFDTHAQSPYVPAVSVQRRPWPLFRHYFRNNVIIF